MGARKVKLSTIVPSLGSNQEELLPGEDLLHDPNFDEGIEDTTADIDALDAAYFGLTPENSKLAIRLAEAGDLTREERQAMAAASEAEFQKRLHSLAPKVTAAIQHGPEAPLTAIELPSTAGKKRSNSNERTTAYLDLEALQAATIAYHRQYHALIADLLQLSGNRTQAENLLQEILVFYRPLLSIHYSELFALLLSCAPKILFYALRFGEFRYYYLSTHNYIQQYQLFDKLLSEDRRFYDKIDFYEQQSLEFFEQGIGQNLATLSEQDQAPLSPELRLDEDAANTPLSNRRAEAQNLLAQYAKMDKRSSQARFLRNKLKEAEVLPPTKTKGRPRRKVRMKTLEDYALIARAKERERLLASGQPLPPELLADLLQGDLSHPETGTIGMHSYLAAQKQKKEQAAKEQAKYFAPEDDETHEQISLEQKLYAALERHNADVANDFGLSADSDFKSPFFGAGKARYVQDLQKSVVRSLYNYVTHDEIVAAQKAGQAPEHIDRPVIDAEENLSTPITQMRRLARLRSYGPIDARYYHPAGEVERRNYRITRPYTFELRRQIEELAGILERDQFSLHHSLLALLCNVVRLKEIFGSDYKSYDLSPYQGQGWFRLEEQQRLCFIVYMGKNVTIRAAQGSLDHDILLQAGDVWQQCLYLEGLEFQVAGEKEEVKRAANHLMGALDRHDNTDKRKRYNPNRPNVISPEVIDPNELCYILL